MTTYNRLHYAFPRLPDSKLLPLLRGKYGTEIELFYDGHVVWIKFENFVIGRAPYLTRNFDGDWNWEKDSALKTYDWDEFMRELGLTTFECDRLLCVEIPHTLKTLEWVNFKHSSYDELPRHKRNTFKSALKLDNSDLLPIRAKLYRGVEMMAEVKYGSGDSVFHPDIYKLEPHHYRWL